MAPFKVTFLPLGKTVEVAPADQGGGKAVHHEGKPGSILDIAESNNIEIAHSCGGFAACSTCHVIIRQGGGSCPPAEEDEEDMLDLAPGLTPQSRLACQAVPDGSQDLVVEIPAINRNIVSG